MDAGKATKTRKKAKKEADKAKSQRRLVMSHKILMSKKLHLLITLH